MLKIVLINRNIQRKRTNAMLILTIILGFIICLRIYAYELGAGVKIPHADELDGLLTKYMTHHNLSHGSASDFLLGIDANESDSSADLDVTVLDMPSLRRILHVASKKIAEGPNARRYEIESDVLLHKNPWVVKKCFDLMKHSIYATRFRLQETNKFREKYSGDRSYNIGVYISTIRLLLNKMESLWSQIWRLPWKSHFIWYLIMYEKILACNIDITFSVQRIFTLHYQFVAMLDFKGEDVGNVTAMLDGAGGLPPGEMPSGGMPSGGMPSGGMPSEGIPSGGMPSGGIPSGGMPSGGMPSGGLPSGGMPSGGIPSGGMPSGGIPSGGMPSGGIPSGGMPSGGMPSGGMPSGGMPPGGMPPGGMPPGGIPSGGMPFG